MAHLDEVLAALREGHGLIVVQEDDIQPYVSSFSNNDIGGLDPVRPVLIWDPEDSFLPCNEYGDELPETGELFEALDFIRMYRGTAVFVLDCRQVDLEEDSRRIRRLLRQLTMLLTDNPTVAAILVVSSPISSELAERVTWIGEEPIEPQEAEAAPRAASPSKERYREIRDLKLFDTQSWEERLEQMRPEEVEMIVESGAYDAALERVNELRRVLKERFARKEDIVDSLCAAAVAHIPTVLIGPPGTAKSNLVRCFCEGLGLGGQSEDDTNGSGGGRKYFEYLLTRYTTPEEIFGPVHVQELIDKQVYRRVTTGYLPEAQIAFLDEIFKASSAILNALLTVLNERIFFNAGKAVKVPLLMVFAASNKAPTDEGLQALYDRFPLRIDCPAVDDEYVGDLLSAAWQQAFDRQFSVEGVVVRRCTCTNDLRLLRHVMRVRFGGRDSVSKSRGGINFTDEFLRFFRSLRSDFGISDRTIAHLLAYSRAHALLNERHELTVDELDVFRHVIWDEAGAGELDRLVNNMKRGVRV